MHYVCFIHRATQRRLVKAPFWIAICHFVKKNHKSLPDVIGDLKYDAIEYEGGEVNCTSICGNLPFNCVIVPYKAQKQKRTKTTVNQRV